MNLADRLRAATRVFKLGEAAFHLHEMDSGHDNSTYSPAEYGNYLVTSNAVYTCSKLRAETLAGFPIKGYYFDPDGKKREVPGHKSLQILKKVNDFWTLNRLIRMTQLCMCVWGRGYWFIEREGPDQRGDPVEIWWGRSDRVRVLPHPKKYIAGYSYDPMDGGKPIFFAPHEVVWFRYPNPLDEFNGLSPLAAARLAADLRSSAAQSNKKLFDQGYMMGGLLSPKNNVRFSEGQAKELEESIQKRFSGQDKAHRWGVLRFEAEMKGNTVSPKDAEFLGTLEWGLEEIARAYGIPLDMVGGQRTYENVQSSERSFIYRTMKPEAEFMAEELTEQYLPMFRKEKEPIDLIEFDLSNLPVLQDAESEQWKREEGQIKSGSLTINEWRETKGKDPVPWGDAWWVEFGRGPVKDETTNLLPANITAEPTGGQESFQASKTRDLPAFGQIEYGGEQHELLFRQHERRITRREDHFKRLLRDLWQRQEDSILAKLRGIKRGEGDADPFDLNEWIKRFRESFRPVLREVVADAGSDALGDLFILTAFDVSAPLVVQAMEKQTQQFATAVNETTWSDLRASLAEGLEIGEGIEKLKDRIKGIFEHYQGADPAAADKLSRLEMISRTEAVRATSVGDIEAWRQSGVVSEKSWLSALSGRTRESHIIAHQTYQAEPIGLDEEFIVGRGSGPGPGLIGLPEEDINCLCVMLPVVNKNT